MLRSPDGLRHVELVVDVRIGPLDIGDDAEVSSDDVALIRPGVVEGRVVGDDVAGDPAAVTGQIRIDCLSL